MGLYDDVYAALHAAGVRFVVVGGTAVVLHGHARMTVDLDLVVDLEVDNALAAVDALTSLGLLPRLPVDPRDVADAAVRTVWVEQRQLDALSFYDPDTAARAVDLLVDPPISYADLEPDAVDVPVAGVAVRVASFEHLLSMKRVSGRPQDLADVAVLESLTDEDPHAADPWAAATFEGAERAQRARIAALSPLTRLAWLDAVVTEAAASGLLDDLRRRTRTAALSAWEQRATTTAV